MAGEVPAFETVHGEGESRRGFGEVGRVDLFYVTQTGHLGARPGPGEQGFHLLGRNVLGLVNNDEAVEESASAHEIECAHFDPAGQQVVGCGAAPCTAFLGLGKHLQIVGQGTHPGGHFLFFCARQVADILAHGYCSPRHDNF